MKDQDQIINALDQLEAFGFSGGKAADCWQRIAEIAIERYAMEQAEMGNDYKEEALSLVEDILENNITL